MPTPIALLVPWIAACAAPVAAATLAQDLVYQSTVGGLPELWVIRAGTAGPTRLLDAGMAGYDPATSADGAVVFMRPALSGEQSLWVHEGAGRPVRRLSPAGADDRMPAFSGDGTRIAFSRRNASGGSDIWVVNADGAGAVKLTDGTGRALNLAPSWSPDGTRIAFSSNRDGYFRIWLMGPDGNALERVTTAGAADLQPSWSPDGRRLAFVRQFSDGTTDLVLRDLVTRAETRIRLPGTENRPAWSPQGTVIAFGSDRDGDLELYTVAPDGSGLTQITHNAVNDLSPAWLVRR